MTSVVLTLAVVKFLFLSTNADWFNGSVNWTKQYRWSDKRNHTYTNQIVNGLSAGIGMTTRSNIKVELYMEEFQLIVNKHTHNESLTTLVSLAYSVGINETELFKHNQGLLPCTNNDHISDDSLVETFLLVIRFNNTNSQIIAVGSTDNFQLLFNYKHRLTPEQMIHFTVVNKSGRRDVRIPDISGNRSIHLSSFSNCGVKGVFSYHINNKILTSFMELPEEEIGTEYDKYRLFSKEDPVCLGKLKLQVFGDHLNISEDNIKIQGRRLSDRKHQLVMIYKETISDYPVIANRKNNCPIHKIELRKVGRGNFLIGIRVHFMIWKFLEDSWTYVADKYNVSVLNFGNRILINYEYKCDNDNNTLIRINNNVHDNHQTSLSTSTMNFPCNINLCHTFKGNTNEATEICVKKNSGKTCKHAKRSVSYNEPQPEYLPDYTRTKLIALTSGCNISIMILVSIIVGVYLKRKIKKEYRTIIMERIVYSYEEMEDRFDLLYERYM